MSLPEFDSQLGLHQELAAAGLEAEQIAASVALPEGDYRRKRRAIRDALASAGQATRMEALVAALLGS